MDAERAERLKQKYAAAGAADGVSGAKKELALGPAAGRGRAMGASGKPKNAVKTIARLIGYLGHEKHLVAAAFVCGLLFSASSLAVSYLLRPIINRFIYYDGNPDISARAAGLFAALAGLGFLYAISVLTQWLQQRLMLEVSQRSLRRLRRELYAKLQTLPIGYFDTHASGDVMSRFTNDIDTVGEMLNTTLIQIVSGFITLAGTIFLMLYTNVILGAITIVMVPVLTQVSRVIIKHGRGAYAQQQRDLGILNGFAQETISGQKVVKVFCHEDEASEEFAWLNEALCVSQIKAQFRAGIMGPVTHQLCNLTYALTACVGAALVVLKGFDIGGLTVSVNYTRQFNRPINEISMQMNTVFSALAGAERVFDVMDQTPEWDARDIRWFKLRDELQERYKLQGGLSRISGHVVLSDVSFGYVPGQTVLHNISLTAKPGQKIAFVGSTGAGKTTVTNLLSRFYELHSGAILFDGVSSEQLPRGFVRENIAMVLQDTHLFTGTVRENIRYGRLSATDEEVYEAARIASADGFIRHLEHGYDTVLEHDGANLSQGQRQLLNIARAAISRAPILVLDEATSSVDTRTERHIEQGMDAIMKNRTTFVIAHRLSTVRSADEILVLEHGRIIERGNHEALLALGGCYADLCAGRAEMS